MRKRLKEFRDWFISFLKDYLPWTGTDQFLDSTAGRRFLAFLGGAVVTGAGWLVSFLTHLPVAVTFILLGGFLFSTVIAVLIFFFSSTSPQLTQKSRYISGDLGWVDSMVNMESAQKVFLEVMGKIAATQNKLNIQIRKNTAAMERIKRSGRNVFYRTRRVAKAVAKSTTDTVADYDEYIPELAESVSFYFDGQLLLLERATPGAPEAQEQLDGLRRAVATLRKNTGESRTVQKAYIQALNKQRGFSQDYNVALDQIIDRLTKLITVLNDVDSRCGAMLTAINAKLAKGTTP